LVVARNMKKGFTVQKHIGASCNPLQTSWIFMLLGGHEVSQEYL